MFYENSACSEKIAGGVRFSTFCPRITPATLKNTSTKKSFLKQLLRIITPNRPSGALEFKMH